MADDSTPDSWAPPFPGLPKDNLGSNAYSASGTDSFTSPFASPQPNSDPMMTSQRYEDMVSAGVSPMTHGVIPPEMVMSMGGNTSGNGDENMKRSNNRGQRRIGAAGVTGITLLSVLILIVTGFGCYLLGTRTGHDNGYSRGFSEASRSMALGADKASRDMASMSSSSSALASSMKAMLPLVNPCSDAYGEREATQTTWGQYGWGCKYTDEDGHRFSVLIGEANRSHVGRPQITKQRNGQTKGCIATGSPAEHPAFGLTVWVAHDKDFDACRLANRKWQEVAKESGQ